MNRLLPARLCAAAIFLVILIPVFPALPAGFLHAQGEDIVDDHGQRILLRGVSLGNWMVTEGYMWRFGEAGDRGRKIEKIVSDMIGPENAAKFWTEYRKSYVTRKDIRRIAELGFNSIRVPLNARLFLSEGANPVYQAEGFALLDHLVSWCRKSGVYLIIDMHAAPGGQTGQNIDDSIGDRLGLFDDPENQDRLVALWVKIASLYKDDPAVAAYDLLNEPLPERTGAELKYKNQLEPLYRRITTAIRKVDQKHMITIEGANWATDWSVFTTRFDDNLVYQFHFYCWDKQTRLNDINQYLNARRRLGAPLWAGETGERDDAIYWGTTDYFESRNIGWCFWPWKKMATGNTPYSVNLPDHWDVIAACMKKDPAEKPTREVAQAAFGELLKNIRLENCIYFPDVVNALFRQVPGRVEAENYGHEGMNRSFFVKLPGRNSDFYRTSEPVAVEPVEPSGQAIRLGSGEWTAYAINSLKKKTYALTVRAEAENAPAAFEISVNGRAQQVSLNNQGWQELILRKVRLSAGGNSIKLTVNKGTVAFDWMEFR